MDLKWCFQLLMLVLGIFYYCPRTRAALSAEEEIRINSVEISFYQLTTSDWTARQDTFKETIAANLNTYCENNSTACGLTQWMANYAFAATNVTVSNTKQVQYEFNITFAVLFKEEVPEADRVLTKTAVTRNALTESLRVYRKALNEAMGSALLTVEQDRYGPEPDTLINIVMSVAGAAFLLFLIILTIVLYHWRKKQDRKGAILDDLVRKREDKKERQVQRDRLSTHSASTRTAVAPNKVVPDQPDVEKGQGHSGHASFHSGNSDSEPVKISL